jgi:hypothetical protein
MKILLAEHFEMCFGVRDALPSEKNSSSRTGVK